MSFPRQSPPTFRSLLQAMTRCCRKPLGRGVDQTDADRYVKRHRSVEFALALISFFILGIDSLRQLKQQLDESPRLRRHVRLNGISNAQLPRLLKDRPSEFWAPLIVELISLLNHRSVPSALRLVDTSFFAMGAAVFSRIHSRDFEPEAAGIKLGMVIDPANNAPVRWDVRVGQGNDIEHVEALMPPDADIRGQIFIFDRGFLKLDWYADLIDRGAHFVTRATRRVTARIVDVNHLDPAHPEILADQTVLLGTPKYRRRLKRLLRRVEVKTKSETLTLWSSDLYRPACEIAQLYHQRWQIEIVFRWLKSTIGCLKPLGYSQNAAEHTLYAALAAFLICMLLAEITISKATKRPTAKIKAALNSIRAGLHDKPKREHLKALGFA